MSRESRHFRRWERQTRQHAWHDARRFTMDLYLGATPPHGSIRHRSRSRTRRAALSPLMAPLFDPQSHQRLGRRPRLSAARHVLLARVGMVSDPPHLAQARNPPRQRRQPACLKLVDGGCRCRDRRRPRCCGAGRPRRRMAGSLHGGWRSCRRGSGGRTSLRAGSAPQTSWTSMVAARGSNALLTVGGKERAWALGERDADGRTLHGGGAVRAEDRVDAQPHPHGSRWHSWHALLDSTIGPSGPRCTRRSPSGRADGSCCLLE